MTITPQLLLVLLGTSNKYAFKQCLKGRNGIEGANVRSAKHTEGPSQGVPILALLLEPNSQGETARRTAETRRRGTLAFFVASIIHASLPSGLDFPEIETA
jgi:hypothetical protein